MAVGKKLCWQAKGVIFGQVEGLTCGPPLYTVPTELHSGQSVSRKLFWASSRCEEVSASQLTTTDFRRTIKDSFEFPDFYEWLSSSQSWPAKQENYRRAGLMVFFPSPLFLSIIVCRGWKLTSNLVGLCEGQIAWLWCYHVAFYWGPIFFLLKPCCSPLASSSFRRFERSLVAAAATTVVLVVVVIMLDITIPGGQVRIVLQSHNSYFSKVGREDHFEREKKRRKWQIRQKENDPIHLVFSYFFVFIFPQVIYNFRQTIVYQKDHYFQEKKKHGP